MLTSFKLILQLLNLKGLHTDFLTQLSLPLQHFALAILRLPHLVRDINDFTFHSYMGFLHAHVLLVELLLMPMLLLLLLLIAHVDALENLSDLLRPHKPEVSCRIPVEGCPPANLGMKPALLILMLLSDLYRPFRGLQRHLIMIHHDWLELKLQRPPGGFQGGLLRLKKSGV